MSFELTLDEGTYLVKLVRRAVTYYLELGRPMTVPSDVKGKLLSKCGVFVTINRVRDGREELRGCIGYPTPELPLIEAALDAAVSASTRDPRFSPVEKDELEEITVEVSVLTPPTLIMVKDPQEYPQKVEIGRDGLIVEQGWLKGLLLPQVPVEWDTILSLKWFQTYYFSQMSTSRG